MQEYRLRKRTTTTLDCAKKFIDRLALGKWAIIEPDENDPEYMQVPQYMRLMLESANGLMDLGNVDDITREFNGNVICEQFTRMLISGHVQNYNQFYQ